METRSVRNPAASDTDRSTLSVCGENMRQLALPSMYPDGVAVLGTDRPRAAWIRRHRSVKMSETRRCEIPTVVDLFAGCGGLSLGLERAGYETVFVNELNHDAMATYLANRRETELGLPENHCNDITELTGRASSAPISTAALDSLGRRLRRGGDVTLVVGGPPCQGYSGIGHRRSFVLHKEEIPSNHLYRDMAQVVKAIAPKAFIFENVRGLLNARWVPSGEKGEIWDDVQRTFRDIRVRKGRKLLSYRVEPALVFAKEYGVPQNRPRVLMVGIREDIALPELKSGVANGFLPSPTGNAPGLEDLLGDLADPDWVPGGVTERYPYDPKNDVQVEFRTSRDGSFVAGMGDPVTDQEYSKHAPEIIRKFQYMLDHGEIPTWGRTKKFAQRVLPRDWSAGGPTITATSLADDYVHYSLPRVPTVREWARIQTFPDWYEFTGKRTTGGRRRAGDPSVGSWARDVPKYTQIGNAVPVKLAEAVGLHLRELLSE